MYDGSNHGPRAQRGAFGRFVAARRTSDRPPHASPLPAVTTTTTGSLRLPHISRGAGALQQSSSAPQLKTSSAPVPQRSSENIDDVTGHVHRKRNEATSSSPSAAFVITERTPRTELLAIVTQLQLDLSQRTDSVNAIQRNFQRLSAMHAAELEELERLRRLQKQQQQNAPQQTTFITADVSAVDDAREAEQLRSEVAQSRETLTALQAEMSRVRNEHRVAVEVSKLEYVYMEERQGLTTAEANAFTALVVAAAAEGASAAVERCLSTVMRAQDAQLLSAVQTHASRLRALSQGKEPSGGSAERDTGVSPAEAAATPAVVAEVSATLRSVEEAVEAFAAEQAGERERVIAAHNAAAVDRTTAMTSQMEALQQTFLDALAASEEDGRHLLESAAADVLADLSFAFQRLCLDVLNREAQRLSSTQAERREQQRQDEARLDAWVSAAADELRGVRDLVDSWCSSCKENLYAQQGHDAHELTAAKAEWESLRATELKAHKAELARVRQESAGRIATAEAKLQKALQSCGSLQTSLDEAHVLQQRAADAAEAAERWRETEVKQALVEREALLGRQWFRVQAAQEAHAQEVSCLLWQVHEVRANCSAEESAARVALTTAHVAAAAHHSRRAGKMKEKAESSLAVWRTRVAQLPEAETAARRLVEATAQSALAVSRAQEEKERESLRHADDLARTQQELAVTRANMEERVAQCCHQEDALRAQLRTAEAECHAAQERAADATTAAQDAREDLRTFKAATTAAAQRIDAAESATESACCCSICLQLVYNPVACVPCGHVFCAGCLLWHARNKSLSSITASATPQHNRRVSGSTAGRAEVEVARWVHGLTVPQSRLYCPECGTAGVSTVVELQSLGELAAKFSYRQGAVKELMRDLS